MQNQSSLILHDYAQEVYLQYAITTVKSRALAQVQDGNKPVHVRILYAMRQLGLTNDAKAVKSARIVGDVLGKYHPHGDSSVYDAMVRLAQDFTLRYPLVSGQGNFGTRDGDSAAAMRYTEAKLSAISELLLGELGSGTVNFRPNYDDTLTEPTMLPSRVPFILLNGTMGIAVGLAADIPPHNIREVISACIKVVDNPDIELDEILEHIPGPDFPEGAQLAATPAEIKAAYQTGRGSLRCRARWELEELARGQWQIAITELPYQVSTRTILVELDNLTNPKIPQGKKALSPQQSALREQALSFLDSAVDESDKDHRIRLVLSPRSSKVSAEQMMAFLLANTSLESNITVNMTLIGLDGRPQTKGLKDILTEWVAFRIETIKRRTAHERDIALKRVHILEGRFLAFSNLNEIIQTIREAENPQLELQTRFELSEIQAVDLLEMRLRQLNRLEGVKLEKELAGLRQEIERLGVLLESSAEQKKLLVEELQADSAKYADDRRTLIKPALKSVAVKPSTEEPLTIVVSKNLWVKGYKGQDVDPATFSFRSGDSLMVAVPCLSANSVVLLDSLGRAYSFSAGAVPSGRTDGVPLTALIDLQDSAKPVWLGSDSSKSELLFATSEGYGFVAQAKSLLAKPKAGKAFLAVSEGFSPLLPLELTAEADYVACGSSAGRLLAYPGAEVKRLPHGGKGVQLQDLGEGETLVLLRGATSNAFNAEAVDAKGVSVPLSWEGEGWLKFIGRRARKGGALPDKCVFRKSDS